MNQHQLQAVRYAMHKVRVKEYRGAVRRGEITPEEACNRYRLAMENLEDVINGAKDGHFAEAIEREMAAFDLGCTMVDALPKEAAE